MENQTENQNAKGKEEIIPTHPKKKSKNPKKSNNNIFIKGATVVGLILVMLIPVPFIIALISERAERQETVIKQIGEQFGGNQTLYGPFIKIPYSVKNDSTSIKYTYLSPENLSVNGNLEPKYKEKGIYKAVLFHTDLKLKATFGSHSLNEIKSDSRYHWDQAQLVFGISEINGLNGNLTVMINGVSHDTKVGEQMSVKEIENNNEEISDYTRNSEQQKKSEIVNELMVPISLKDMANLSVSFSASINGVNNLNFLPVAKNTDIQINSSTEAIKLNGPFIPNSLEPTEGGEKIIWKVNSQGGNQIWNNTFEDFSKNKFGITVLQSFNEYGKTNRVAKYAILFIGLTFVTLFFIEIINKLKIHPVQYVLVGLAISIFYLLLLSISEQIGFNRSYIISGIATILLICWFIQSIVKKVKIVGIVFSVLVLLYSYIFIIIQLDELALLSGSIGLFVILALLMYFSRKIEWKQE